jgi:O-antigen ligase
VQDSIPAIKKSVLRTDKIARLFLAGLFFASVAWSPWSLDPCLTPRLVFLAVFLLLVAYSYYQSWSRVTFRLDLLSSVLLIYLAAHFAGIFTSLNLPEALLEVSRLVLFVCVYLLATRLFSLHSEAMVKLVARLAALIFLTGLVVFIWQVATIRRLDKESTYLLTSLYAHKNLYSSFLFLQLPFLIMLSGSRSRPWKVTGWFCVIGTMAILILLRTKSVWLGLPAMALCYWLLRFTPRQKKLKAATIVCTISVALLLVFFATLLPWFLTSQMDPEKPGQPAKGAISRVDPERVQLWYKSYHVINKSPVTGVGPGNWQIHFPDATLTGIWRAEDLNFTFQRPHNDYLWVLAETGYLGLTLLLVFLSATICFSVFAIRTPDDDPVKQVRLLLAATIGFLVISFFDFPKERIEHLAWFAVTLGYLRSEILRLGLLKPLLKVDLSPALWLVPLGVLASVALTGYLRHSGEHHTRLMYDQKADGDVKQLIKEANRAQSFVYKSDPLSVPLAWYRGNAYALSGDTILTLREFREAYALHPYSHHVLNDLASALAINGKPDSAKYYYREASRISPRFDEAKLNLAALHIREANFSSADSVLRTVMHDSERRTRYETIVRSFVGHE